MIHYVIAMYSNPDFKIEKQVKKDTSMRSRFGNVEAGQVKTTLPI